MSLHQLLPLLLLLLLPPTIASSQSCHTLLQTQAEASLTHIPTPRITRLFPGSPSLTATLTALETTVRHCTPTQSLHVVLPSHTKALLNNPSLPAVNSVTITPACRILQAGGTPPVYLLDGVGLGMESTPPAPFLGIDVLPVVVVEIVVRFSCDAESVEQVVLGDVEVGRLREVAGRAFLVGRVGA